MRQVNNFLAGIDFGVPAGQKLTVIRGQKVRVTCSFQYMGPAKSFTLYATIGTRRVGFFDEVAKQSGVINLPQCSSFTQQQFYVDIDTSPLAAGIYGMQAKISEAVSDTLTELSQVIEVIGAEGKFQNFKIESYDVVS